MQVFIVGNWWENNGFDTGGQGRVYINIFADLIVQGASENLTSTLKQFRFIPFFHISFSRASVELTGVCKKKTHLAGIWNVY